MSDGAFKLYTTREAAAILRVHERTVLRWVASGRLSARRIGRLIRIEEDALRTSGQPNAAAQEGAQHGGTIRTGPRRKAARKGSPAALLRASGKLRVEDAAALMKAVQEAEAVDWEEPSALPA